MIEDLFQPTHLIFIVIIALIVLGPSKLGDVGGALGRSVREFKQNTEGVVGESSRAEHVSVLTSRTAAQKPNISVASSAEGIHATDV
ncbi:MAG: twin-arginine translocase TatA/TatE family subunit [Thermomicrobiales bacterium]